MLQSNRYTDAYLPEALEMLEAILAGSLVIDRKAIQDLNTKYAAGTRTGKIFKPARIRDNIVWHKTILDSAEHYQNDVIEWASHISQVVRQELVDE
jgi:hypothetical protein